MDRSCAISASVGSALLVALLLTGCGDSDDGAPASPSSAASASTPPPASAAVTPSPGATPADYVPASLDGPAQNVPKPVMPELAKQESKEGAQAFLDYWSDAKWYAYETGDSSLVRDITSPHCEACVAEFDDLEEIYAEGMWTVGGRDSITILDAELVEAPDEVYKPMVQYSREDGQLVKKGKVKRRAAGEPNDPSLVYIDYTDTGWVYITLAPIAGEE
jgi:hypothetical protein